LPLSEEKSKYNVVGESWELSVEPDFPSVALDGKPLAELLVSDPVYMLGLEAAGGQTATALLVKLLDAGDDLSIQIHPPDDYAGLRPGETGKVEAWYVVERQPGAGIYLGIDPGVTEPEMRRALTTGADLSTMLNFVPVEPGDLFVVEPGVPHSLGKGVTLVEPQIVAPGLRGITYRYWDWNRLYDKEGLQQPGTGRPRALHVEDALAVTDWAGAMGDRLLRDCRLEAGAAPTDAEARVELLCSAEGGAGIRCNRLRVARLSGTGVVRVPGWEVLRALTVLQGRAVMENFGSELVVSTGQTVALPAGAGALQVRLQAAHALVCAVDGEPGTARGEGR
jgi:mannose-6-phosphate isomerase